MPRVSVCCSVLNQSEWLTEMVASVIAQSFEDWELIVVDDGSTEDVHAAVAKFSDARIRYHRFEKNRGLPHGINWAFQHATGEYIQPLAADEILYDKKLEIQVKFLDEHSEIAVCWGLPRPGKMGERPEWERYFLKAHDRNRAQWVKTLLELDGVPIGGCGALWRRSLFESIGYFDERLTLFSDHEWYTRLFMSGYEARMLPQRLAVSRPSKDAASAIRQASMEAYSREFPYVKAKHGTPITAYEELVTIAIPCRNMGGFIADAIDSVMAQTHKKLEIIIVDDGSDDDTMEKIQILLARYRDPRICVYPFVENKGDKEACNFMLARAIGAFFVPLSADDRLEPTYLEQCVEELNADQTLEFVASQTDFFDAQGKQGEILPGADKPHLSEHPLAMIERASNKTQDEWKARLRHGNVYFGAGMYRTKTLRDLGGWDQQWKVLADYEMYLRLVQRGNIRIIEANLTHTRIHETNMSTHVDQEWLHKTYRALWTRFYPPRTKLIIATPFYEMRGFSPYIVSLVNTCKLLTLLGIDWDYWEVSGDSYVERAKNTIVNKFLEDEDATDLLMIDSDMSWNPDAVVKILNCPEEIVVGSYPMKNAWNRWASNAKYQDDEDGKSYTVGRVLEDGSALIEGGDLAGGFVRIRRGPLERYKAFFPDKVYRDLGADQDKPDRIYTEFYACERYNPLGAGEVPTRFGEDRTFSRRLKEMGEKWWIYTNITFGHYGIKEWLGNFDTYLKDLKAQEDSAVTQSVH